MLGKPIAQYLKTSAALQLDLWEAKFKRSPSPQEGVIDPDGFGHTILREFLWSFFSLSL